MKKFAIVALLAAAATAGELSFSSRRYYGKDEIPEQYKEKIQVTKVEQENNEPDRAVSFSSKGDIGGNWQGEHERLAGLSPSFTSARRTGVRTGLGKLDYSDSMQAVREEHTGVSFSSSRTVGLYITKEADDNTSLYTTISNAIEEEDWAVKNAVLWTLFLTLIFALAVGIFLGCFCFASCCVKSKDVED